MDIYLQTISTTVSLNQKIYFSREIMRHELEVGG